MKNNSKNITKHMKNNVRLFPFYKAISWDLLFYFPIIFLFLTQVKGFTPAEVLLADSFYTMCNMFWQLPVSSVVDKIGKKNCLIIGNILYSLSIFAMIFMTNYYELLLTQFVYALGYSTKVICESNILYDSLPAGQSRGRIFSKIDGKSSSYFYITDAVASILAGLTFVVNGYIPMVLCFLSCVGCTILSFRFKNTTTVERAVEPIPLKTYFSQIKDAFRFFKNSKRLKSLILFNAIFMGIVYGIVNLRSGILSEMQVPDLYFGIIFAALQFAAAITSRKTDVIQKTLKNKTLGVLAVPVALSCIFIGIIGYDNTSFSSVIMIFLLFLVQYLIKGPYMASMSRYLNNFTNKQIRPKISALKNLMSNLFVSLISLICAGLLTFTSSANTFIIIGCVSTLIVIYLIEYMKDKVGLKPNQYTEADIKYAINRPKLSEKKVTYNK